MLPFAYAGLSLSLILLQALHVRTPKASNCLGLKYWDSVGEDGGKSLWHAAFGLCWSRGSTLFFISFFLPNRIPTQSALGRMWGRRCAAFGPGQAGKRQHTDSPQSLGLLPQASHQHGLKTRVRKDGVLPFAHSSQKATHHFFFLLSSLMESQQSRPS